MKKILHIMVVMASLFAFSSIKAEPIDMCNQENYGNKSCSFSVWAVGHLFDKASIKCGDEKPTRGYEAIDKNGNVAYIACYKTDKAFFFKSYEYNTKTKQCEWVLGDAIKYEDKFSYLLAFTYDSSWNPADKECPAFFGNHKKDKLFYFNQYYFTNNLGNINENKQNVGETTVDEEAIERMKTCVKDKIDTANCEGFDINNVINECVKEVVGNAKDADGNPITGEMKTNYQEELVDKYNEEVQAEMNKYADEKIIKCTLKTNCSLTDAEVQSYIDLVNSKNGADVTEAELLKIVNETKAACILGKEEEIEEEQAAVEDTIKEEMDDYSEEAKEYNSSLIASLRTKGDAPGIDFGSGGESCISWVGENLSKVIRSMMTIIRIIGAIAAIVVGMLSLVPAVISKDADALKKASSKCVKLAVVLAIIGIFPSLINFLGTIFKFDLSCLF